MIDDPMELTIEKGIPAPKGVTETLREMVVGDSLFIPYSKSEYSLSIAHAVLGKGNYRSKKDENGIRVWRIK